MGYVVDLIVLLQSPNDVQSERSGRQRYALLLFGCQGNWSTKVKDESEVRFAIMMVSGPINVNVCFQLSWTSKLQLQIYGRLQVP